MHRAMAAAVLPPWITKAVIVAILTALIGGAGAWIGFVNRSIGSTSKIDVAQDERINAADKRTDAVVDELKTVNQTLGDIRDRLPPKEAYGPRYIYVQPHKPKPETKTPDEVMNGE